MDTLNLILLVTLLLLLFIFLGVRGFFTAKYVAYEMPIINSANDVISNKDLQQIVLFYQKLFQLGDYELVFKETESFYSLAKGSTKINKKIVFSKVIFASVGYELDYLIGTLWIASQKFVKKNKLVKFYLFANRYGFNLCFFFLFIFFLISLAFYLVVGVTNNGFVENKTVQFFYDIPLFGMLGILTFLSAILNYFLLMRLKPMIENQYNKDIETSFNQNFKEYSFDLKAARNYATQLPLPHNFAFKTNANNQKIKWLGPFVKN